MVIDTSGSINVANTENIYPQRQCGFAEETTAWEEFLLMVMELFDQEERERQLSFYYSSPQSEKIEQRIRFLNIYNSLENEDCYWTEMSYYRDQNFLQNFFDD